METEREEKKAGMPWAHLRLPPFPQVAIRVLQLANNENVQIRQLSELISSDPAFASEVLTIANSLLYAPRFPASSIWQAIAVLGANHLQGMCMTVGMRAYLGRTLSNPAMRGLWRHSLACAMIAEQLACAGSVDGDKAHTAGVLHDIGRFALSVIRPNEYSELLGKQKGTAVSILEGERELFGWNHCEVGRRLIVEWKLSSEFDAVVFDHHSPRAEDGAGDSMSLGELIKASCRLADAVGYRAFPGCEAAPYAELLEELPVKERNQLPPEAEALAAEVAERINAVESV